MKRAYKVVDVFSSQPLLGNPVAVVLNAEGLDDPTMQRFARWTNLSETTFVLPPTRAGADYRLRIFTQRNEVPFAGHPTLGSAHAVMEAGLSTPREGVLIQESAVGLIEIQVQRAEMRSRLALSQQTAVISPVIENHAQSLEAIVGTRLDREGGPAAVNVGVAWVVAQVPSVEALLALRPDFARLADFERRLGVVGVSVYAEYPQGQSPAIEVRSFLPSSGVNEDPVCGSGNGAIAAHRLSRGMLPTMGGSYTASQGRCVGRGGLVFVEMNAQGQIRIGGECITCIDGHVANCP